MNAAHPNATPADAGEGRVPEPSMEEILASIRRIIADDQSFPHAAALREATSLRPTIEPTAVHVLHPEPAPTAAAPAHEMARVAPAPESAPEPTIMAPQYPGMPGPNPGIPTPEPVAAAPEPAPAPEPPPSTHAVDPAVQTTMKAPMPETFASAPAAAEPADPEDEPYEMPLGHHPTPDDSHGLVSAATNQSLTSAFNMLAATRLADNSEQLLSIVRDMIRPMLRDWLDDNLPTLVERLVRAEIERVSRGGR